MSISFDATCPNEECQKSLAVYVDSKNQSMGVADYQYKCPECKKTVTNTPWTYCVDFEKETPADAVFATKVVGNRNG